MKIAYIYSELPSYVRVKKNIKIFQDLGHSVVYIGCNRDGKTYDSSLDSFTCKIYQKKIPHGGFSSLVGSIQFLLFAIKNLRDADPDVLIFCNEEYYLAAVLSMKRYKYTVCEVLDSLSIRVVGRLSIFNALFTFYCNYVRKHVDLIVEMNQARLSLYPMNYRNAIVIPNANTDISAIECDLPFKLPDNFIFVSGSIVEGINGLETLVAAAMHFQNLYIVYAGRSEEVFIRYTSQFERVVLLGNLEPKVAVAVGARATAMWAHYRPVNFNYLYAAPNKLYDAIATGVPLLINSECKASDDAINAGIGFVSDYGNKEQLINKINEILRFDNSIASTIRSNAIELYKVKYSSSVIKDMWANILGNVRE